MISLFRHGVRVGLSATTSAGTRPGERKARLLLEVLRDRQADVLRFAQCLQTAGFDEAMKAALRAEDVLCADETPTNVIHKDTDEQGEPVPGSPHAVTVRTPDARLVWYAPIGSRSKTALVGLGVLEGYAGYLVRDDYAGWHQFDAQLAGVGQCAAHYADIVVMPMSGRSVLVGGGARVGEVGIIAAA